MQWSLSASGGSFILRGMVVVHILLTINYMFETMSGLHLQVLHEKHFLLYILKKKQAKSNDYITMHFFTNKAKCF